MLAGIVFNGSTAVFQTSRDGVRISLPAPINNGMIYKQIDSIDSKSLLDFYENIETKLTWLDDNTKSKQSGLQYLPIPEVDQFLCGTGKTQYPDSVFTRIIDLYKNTICENIIQKYKLTRTRWMWVYPYSCYSIHHDFAARIHIPLITNSSNLFLFPDQNLTFNLELNKVYWVDTTKRHTFMNCSSEFRLHLVGASCA